MILKRKILLFIQPIMLKNECWLAKHADNLALREKNRPFGFRILDKLNSLYWKLLSNF